MDGDRRFTYSEMQRRVHSFGAALQHAGIAPGDRVAVLARNGLLPLEAHFAVPLIGAVLVTLNIRLQCGELATILNHAGARILLGDADLLAPLQAMRAQIPQVERFISDYEAFLSEGSKPVVPHAPGEEDVISINYTSGTTGVPKGVMYTHRGAYLNAIGEVVEHGLVVPLGLPVDAAHVSLQRLVLPLGGYGGGRAADMSAGSERRTRRQANRGGRRHPSLRCAHRRAHAYRVLLAPRDSFST